MPSEYRSEYQAWLRREQRRERVARATGCVLMGLSGLLMALLMYFAFIGFLILFGGK